MNILKIKPVIMAYVLVLGMLAMHGVANADDASGMEKCYGVAKAGQNDCDPSTPACDKSVIDGDPNYYMNVPKGMCNKLVGGMTAISGGQSGVTTMPMTTPSTSTTPMTTPMDPSATPTTQAIPGMPPVAPPSTPNGGATMGGTSTGAGSSGTGSAAPTGY